MCAIKIKVVRRTLESLDEMKKEFVYDVYHGFTGMPSTFPFYTKWVLDRSGLSEKDVMKIIKYWTIDSMNEAIIKSKLVWK